MATPSSAKSGTQRQHSHSSEVVVAIDRQQAQHLSGIKLPTSLRKYKISGWHDHRRHANTKGARKEPMSYVYKDVDELAKGKTPLAGTGTCVDIIKKYVPGLIGKSTTTWRPGAWVMQAGASIPKGTAIATFGPDGRFPHSEHGQHAAIVVRVMGSGIWVVDQWKGDPLKPTISLHLIRVPPPHKQRNSDGSFHDMSNNALAFRVIE
jgi:hypothetical protein